MGEIYKCSNCAKLVPKQEEIVLGCITFCCAKCVRAWCIDEIGRVNESRDRRVADLEATYKRFCDPKFLERIGAKI